MTPETRDIVPQVLKLAEDIYNAMRLDIPVEWLHSDLTVAQLRVLLVLQSQGRSRMSDIAATIGVALPTATGIVDKLVKKGLAQRQKDTQDRRLVICRLSPRGQELINKMWTSGQFQIASLLDGLNEEQLQKVHEVARILYENVVRNTRAAGGGRE